MESLWQHALVTAAVVGAVVWLVRRRLKKRRGCDDCALADAVARTGDPAPRD